MGNCCRGESSTPVLVAGSDDRRAPAPKNHRAMVAQPSQSSDEGDQNYGSGGRKGNNNLREVKIRMTKKELEELVGWLNMADSSFEHIMNRLVNVVISDDQNGISEEDGDDDNNAQVVKLRPQRSWRPSLHSIPEIN